MHEMQLVGWQPALSRLSHKEEASLDLRSEETHDAIFGT